MRKNQNQGQKKEEEIQIEMDEKMKRSRRVEVRYEESLPQTWLPGFMVAFTRFLR